MSDNTGHKDQSMNEILGSIRRIISEDNAQSGGPSIAAVDDDEEIIDLTDEVTDDEPEPRLDTNFGQEQGNPQETEVRREPVLGLHSPAPVEQEPEEEAGRAQPAEEAAQDESSFAAHGSQTLASETQVSEEIQREMQPEEHSDSGEETPVEPAPAIRQEPAVEPEPPVEMAQQLEPDAPKGHQASVDIVSEAATAATASAIGELTRAMEEKSSKLKLGTDEATISDIVKEMLRPMLREWLDENLPGIVERVVRREIQKLVDRADADD